MQRPSRKLNNLVAKAERKLARSRRPGPKAKRWRRQIEQFKSLVEGTGDGVAKPQKAKGDAGE